MKRQRRKGAALASVLVLFFILTILGFALTNLALAENRFSIRQENQTKAYYIARAGAVATSAWLADSSETIDSIKTLITSNQINNDTWTDFESGKFKISFPGTNEFRPVIQSVGEYRGVSRTVSVAMRKRYFFDMAAVVALSELNIKNANTEIDGNVLLASGAIINPPMGNHDLGDIITGTIDSTNREFPPVEYPDPELQISAWPSTNIIDAGGPYANKNFEVVNLGSTVVNINLNGDMAIQFSSLSGNNATINVNGTGNLVIYADTVSFKGNLNTANTATTTLMIFESGDVDFQTGGGEFQAYIYAPEAEITVKANYGSIGAIIADVVNLESGATISFDENLANVYPEDLGFPSEGYERDFWTE